MADTEMNRDATGALPPKQVAASELLTAADIIAFKKTIPILNKTVTVDDIAAACTMPTDAVAQEIMNLWIFAHRTADTAIHSIDKNAELNTRINEQNEQLTTLLEHGYENNNRLEKLTVDLRTKITQLEAEKSVLVGFASSGGGNGNARRSAEHPDPDTFDGENTKLLRSFLSDMMIKLRVNADWYPDEFHRMSYFLSRLRGKAKGQVKGGQTITGDITFKNVQEIVDILNSAFGDINEKATSQASLFSILQGNRSLAAFLPEWQETASTSQFGDEALIALLKRALHSEITSRLSFIPLDQHKADIFGFVAQIRGIDNILRSVNPNYHRNKAQPVPGLPAVATTSSSPVGLTTTDGGSAMDLSMMEIGPPCDPWTAKDVTDKRKPKTLNERDAKKKYCFANGLCTWCYGKHSGNVCPTAPWNQGKAKGKA